MFWCSGQVYLVTFLNNPTLFPITVLGLLFARLLKLNGAAKVVLASNKGAKMDKAKELTIADEYVEFDRENPDEQWADLKIRYPYGFDAVVRRLIFRLTHIIALTG